MDAKFKECVLISVKHFCSRKLTKLIFQKIQFEILKIIIVKTSINTKTIFFIIKKKIKLIVYLINNESNGDWSALTFLQVFRTTLDGGASELFAVGKIKDKIREEGGTLKLLDRDIQLETRMFGFGHHIPF